MTQFSPADGQTGQAPAKAPPRLEILHVGMNGDQRGKQIPRAAEKKIRDQLDHIPTLEAA